MSDPALRLELVALGVFVLYFSRGWRRAVQLIEAPVTDRSFMSAVARFEPVLRRR